MFHVSQLRKYVPDPSHVLNYLPLQIQEDLSNTEKSVQILDRKEKQLRNKTIALVKILWPCKEMQKSFSQLFQSTLSFKDETLLRGTEM